MFFHRALDSSLNPASMGKAVDHSHHYNVRNPQNPILIIKALTLLALGDAFIVVGFSPASTMKRLLGRVAG